MRTLCVMVDRGFNTAVLKDPLGRRRMRKKRETTAPCPKATQPEEGQAAGPCSVLGNDLETCRGAPCRESWAVHPLIPAWWWRMHVTNDQRK